LIANGVVIVPSYVHDGTPQPVEDRVGQIMREAFPGRSVLFVRCTPMNWHGGGLHCATLSEPKSD
ncbi:MAG TPA: agmatine deiminase family protein, partial [Phycisphaerales bacterium]|nr:agmatine deiminase family protein [Phycisphaerales bacterium]